MKQSARAAVITAAFLLSGGIAATAALAMQDREDPGDRDPDLIEAAADRADQDLDRFEIPADDRGPPEADREPIADPEPSDAEDLADPGDAAEDAAKDAEDTAEDAAKEAEDAAEEAWAAGATGLRDLVSVEQPELDRQGYPVRRGELVALDLSSATRRAAVSRGFSVLESSRLGGIRAVVTRLAVPRGMSASDGLNMLQAIDSAGVFDFAHYYGLHYGPVGAIVGTPRRAAMPRTAAAGRDRPRIGMIDTGVAAHPSLAGVRLRSRDFGSRSPTQTAHGTAVASLLASAGAGQILAANVFRGDGQRGYTSAESIIRALAWLVEEDVPVINISLAGPRNQILDRLIARVQASGHIVVAAAGNGGPTAPPAYPAAQPQVVAVTAVDSHNRIYRYANRGSYIAVSARGVAVPAAVPGGSVAPHTGTSFAAPYVAVVLARCARRVSSANFACVTAMERRARDLGEPGRDPVYGAGLVE